VTTLAPTVESFFTSYLIAQRGVSTHTVASYRDTFRLLFTWIRTRTGTEPSRLDFTDVDATAIGAFLAMLEDQRHNSDRTLAQRLAAIHSLFRHAALRHPEHAELIARVLAVRPRQASRKIVPYLTEAEVDALLDAPNRDTWTGRRDHLLILVMVTAGPRVSEVTALTWADLSLTRPGAHVLWHGKGRKERTTPLRPATIASLNAWHRENPAPPGGTVFTALSTTRKLSTDAVADRLHRHAETAAKTSPSLTAKNVTPHVLRHSFAMRLQEKGAGSHTIALLLGHETPASTRPYLHADLELKQRALDRTAPPNTRRGRYTAPDSLLAFLENL